MKFECQIISVDTHTFLIAPTKEDMKGLRKSENGSNYYQAISLLKEEINSYVQEYYPGKMPFKFPHEENPQILFTIPPHDQPPIYHNTVEYKRDNINEDDVAKNA